jgi:hypothetical protein
VKRTRLSRRDLHVVDSLSNEVEQIGSDGSSVILKAQPTTFGAKSHAYCDIFAPYDVLKTIAFGVELWHQTVPNTSMTSPCEEYKMI